MKLNICEQGYYNIVEAYLKQMVLDYSRAVEKNDIDEIFGIEESIKSDNYFGDICNIPSDLMLRKIRSYGYNTNKYKIKRDKYGYPIEVIKKEGNHGKSRGCASNSTKKERMQHILDIAPKQS